MEAEEIFTDRIMIKKLLEECEKKENFFSLKGMVPEDIVITVESGLGVILNEDYCYFLENYGFAIWFGHRICGVSDIDECSTAYYTKIARADSLELADLSIVILPYDAGGYYMLVCRGKKKGKVVLVETRTGKVVEVFKSFSVFIQYLLDVSPKIQDVDINK